MRAILQRVKKASVTVDGKEVGVTGPGMVVFLGVEKGDTLLDATYLASKVVSLRIFADRSGRFNLSLLDTEGECLIVSQFTLLGDCRKGKRPSFDRAASPGLARQLYMLFITEVQKRGVPVATGEFQAMMDVALVNDGPVTILLDSKKLF